MLRGLTKVTLDAKGRLAIPTRYREQLAERCDGRLVVTMDQQKCVLIYPEPVWEDVERDLTRRANLDSLARALQQLLIGHACDVVLDNNGRILVPRTLRDVAGIDRQGMLAGVGKKFELWDEDRWNEKRDALLEIDFDSISPESLKDFSY